MTEPEWVAALRSPTDHPLRVLIAGSRALPRQSAPRLLLNFVASLPDDALVLVRGRANGKQGDFERDVRALCRIAGLNVQVCAPWPTQKPSGYLEVNDEEWWSVIGREGVLLRDRTMVDLADVVLAFIEDWQLERPEFSGTRHIVETAFARDKATFLYALNPEGKVRQIGNHDPLNAWSEKVPQP